MFEPLRIFTKGNRGAETKATQPDRERPLKLMGFYSRQIRESAQSPQSSSYNTRRNAESKEITGPKRGNAKERLNKS